jgi:hypothetical protein
VIYPLFHVTSSIVALKTVSLLLGALVTYFAYKAYRRTGAAALGYLALGFGIVTVGAMAAGLIDRALPYPSDWALLVESALTAVGFAVIVYSLYSR